MTTFFFCFSNFQLVTCEKHILLYQKFINIIIICNANLEHMRHYLCKV